MKLLIFTLFTSLSSLAYADFNKTNNRIIGTWLIDEAKSDELWNEFATWLIEAFKDSLEGEELQEFERDFKEAQIQAEKEKKIKIDKIIKIDKEKILIIENKKIILDAYYTLFMAKKGEILLNVYSLKHEENQLNEYYNISFDQDFLVINNNEDFISEWYSKK